MKALRNFLRSQPGAGTQMAILLACLFIFRGSAWWLVLPTTLIAVILFYLTGDKWSTLGFSRPTMPINRWALEGGVTGVLCGLVVAGLLTPWLNQVFNIQSNPGLNRGDVAYFITNVIIYGIVHALAKSFAYRAFFIHRLETLIGQSQASLVAVVILGAGVLALSNLHARLSTIVATFLVGLVFNALFYWSRRNIWPTILAHGLYNTTLFVLAFLGRL